MAVRVSGSSPGKGENCSALALCSEKFERDMGVRVDAVLQKIA